MQRAFSLTGIAPLGAFLVLHLAVNARALHGAAAFAGAVTSLDTVPGLRLLEVLLVYPALLVHGAIGVWLVASRRSLDRQRPYSPGVRTGVRATGIVLAAFLALHLAELGGLLAPGPLRGAAVATRLDASLSSVTFGVPWRGVAYLVGTGCAVFHLAAGLWGVIAATGRGRSSIQARRWSAWALAGLGAAMWLVFADVVVFRATGAALFGDFREDPPGARCP